MSDCEYLQRCLFFNDKMDRMPAVANLIKSRLCRGDSSQCARYMVATDLGRESVPADLYPDDTMRAYEMLDK